MMVQNNIEMFPLKFYLRIIFLNVLNFNIERILYHHIHYRLISILKTVGNDDSDEFFIRIFFRKYLSFPTSLVFF